MTLEQKLNEAYRLIQNGLYDESINILLELASNYRDFNISYLLGVAYQRTNNYILAERYYNDVILIKPDHYSAYLGLGITYQKQSKFSEAINSIEKTISINNSFEDAYNSLGYTYKLKGDYNKAIDIYQKGIEVLFDNIYHYINKNKEFVEEETVEDKFKADLWFETAIKTIVKNASNDGIDKVRFPTPETVENIRESNPYGSELFIDDGEVRSILPNMLNNFADKLSRDIQYANFLNNIGVVLLAIDEKARPYFIEAIIFTPKNVDFQNPINNLAYTKE
jgi:tetratricopeptide (TPR) repeat protein